MQSASTITARSIRNKGSNRVESTRSTAAGRGNLAGAPPDEELIARVRWHEEPALAAIYDRYSRLIYTIALRIVGDIARHAQPAGDLRKRRRKTRCAFSEREEFIIVFFEKAVSHSSPPPGNAAWTDRSGIRS